MKANIRAKLANKGKKAFFQKFDKPTKKSGRKVNLDHKRKNRIEFVEPIVEEETDFEFSGKTSHNSFGWSCLDHGAFTVLKKSRLR